MLRLAQAAARLGVHPLTLRRWTIEGKITCHRIGKQRRFSSEVIDTLLGTLPAARPRVEALYVRVSGGTGQGTSLAAQEAELRASATAEVSAVFKDRASGLREDRPGLARLLKQARAGEFTVVRVTHEDRLARFGVSWIKALLERDNVTVEVLHPKGSAGGMDELLTDFMMLVTTFTGRIYGIRSREARRRLLVQAKAHLAADKEK